MRTLRHAALLVLAAFVLAAPAAMADDDANAAAQAAREKQATKSRSNIQNNRTAQGAEPPAPAAAAAREKQATRSRSNIANNRLATDGAGDESAPGAEAAGVVKTKTKSNQSND